MSTVTGRINEITQPRGGYIKPSRFDIRKLDDGKSLCDEENISASIVGLTVDYLTRFIMGANVDEAFAISKRGALNAFMNGDFEATEMVEFFLRGIQGIDEESVIKACKLTTYDVWYRNPSAAPMSKSAYEIEPDGYTIQNIQIMVERSSAFWKEYGPIVKDEFTFEPNGYTKTVSAGDGDFLTKDTIWDFKVLRKAPTSKHTLQLLMYWIMGQHSGNDIFKDISNLGIFNPRLNTVYTLPISKVEPAIIKIVETDVICY